MSSESGKPSKTGFWVSTVFGIALAVALGFGLYNYAQVVFRGKSQEEIDERVQRQLFPQNPPVWFWFLVPILLPLFVSIYMLFLMLLGMMIGYPLSRFVPGVLEANGGPMATAFTVIAWGVGLYSMGLLWHAMRKQWREQLRSRARDAGETR